MTTLTALRSELAAALAPAGYATLYTSRAGITPPAVVIAHGDPWLEQGDTFRADQFRVHLDLILLSGTGTSAVALAAMETMAAKVLLNLPEQWNIDNVSEPYLTKPNTNTEYLTCQIQVSATISLTI